MRNYKSHQVKEEIIDSYVNCKSAKHVFLLDVFFDEASPMHFGYRSSNRCSGAGDNICGGDVAVAATGNQRTT